MGRCLPRVLAPVERLSPGEYTRETASGEAAICCPECGEVADLLPPYRVLPHSGGIVSPRWLCESMSCAYQEFLVLESYDEDVAW